MPGPEFITRKRFIDKQLNDSGWTPILPFSETAPHIRVAFEEVPTEAGPADYVLFDNDRPLAVVEAKKQALGPQNVLQQAQRY